MNASPLLSGIDSVVLGVYSAVADAADQLGIRWVIIGATARDLVYENWFGISPRRRTSDVDLAIEVESWDDYARLRTALLDKGAFVECEHERQCLKFSETGLELDIVPFGGIEENDRISWPPEHDFRMTAHGLADALDTSLSLVLKAGPDIPVRVIHPAVLVATKLFAWADRPDRRKDAGDAAFMICEYEKILDNRERLFGDHADLLEQEDFDLEAAYAELMGRDLAQLLRTPSLQALRQVLAKEISRGEASRLAADMALQAEISPERCWALLIALQKGARLTG